MPRFGVLRSFLRVCRYHLGSLAFGSLILAIVQTIRLVLQVVRNQLKRQSGSRIAEVMLACLECFFCCLNAFLKFLTKHAFIEVGESCSAMDYV